MARSADKILSMQSMIFRSHTGHIVEGEVVLEFARPIFRTRINRAAHG
jgi:hypothetical protein